MTDTGSNDALEDLFSQLAQAGDKAAPELIHELLASGPELAPRLIAVLEDRAVWQAEEPQIWLPLHAVKLLGSMQSAEAVSALITALNHADDFQQEAEFESALELMSEAVLDDLPSVFAQIGVRALAPLMAYLNEYRTDDWRSSLAANAIIGIAHLHPEVRSEALALLHGFLTGSEEQDPGFLSRIAASLLVLGDETSLSLLDAAFEADLINDWVTDQSHVDFVRRKGPNQSVLQGYAQDLLAFYEPEAAARRKKLREQAAMMEEQAAEQGARETTERRASWWKGWEAQLTAERRRLAAAALPDYWLQNNPLVEHEPGQPLHKRKTGRTEPCPCGSGRKYKKCCGPLLDRVPAWNLLGFPHFTLMEDMEALPAFAPALAVQNMAALARSAALRDEPGRALEILQEIEPVAARAGLLKPLLMDQISVYVENPALGENGVAGLQRLLQVHEEPEAQADIRQGLAEYLANSARADEAAAEYRELISRYPRHAPGRISLARFLTEQGQLDEAVTTYIAALYLDDEESRMLAAEELDDLVLDHDMKLDEQTLATLDEYLPELPDDD